LTHSGNESEVVGGQPFFNLWAHTE